MLKATFTRLGDFDSDLAEIESWFGAKFDYMEVITGKRCATVYCTSALTQQEQDDITANASAKFIPVVFSA